MALFTESSKATLWCITGQPKGTSGIRIGTGETVRVKPLHLENGAVESSEDIGRNILVEYTSHIPFIVT
ncbi:MAG: hypothetical protein VXX85_06925 [Candidatus Margulisiibacteriota bacterium]|nr:hypothetical protein [Candidatus Margulisiibacteriota bacterium]